MSKQKSLMETWTDIESATPTRRSIQSYLPLALSAAGALAVAPFAVIRWMNGDWLLGTIDTVIVASFVTLGTYVYRTRKVRVASIALTVIFVSGALATIYIRGPQQIFWIFPSLMATFFMLKPREALVVASLMVAALIPQLVSLEETFLASTTIITILTTSAFAYAFSEVNQQQQQQLLQLATKDSLTGVGNRRAFRNRLAKIVASYGRESSPASLIVLDIDHFKVVNDVHGHTTGDKLLRRIAQIVDMRIRVSDGLYRIGGEEFVVIIEGQRANVAAQLAENLRVLIENHELLPGVSVTVSMGVAELGGGETRNGWFRRADDALYAAKRAGRNMTKLAAAR